MANVEDRAYIESREQARHQKAGHRLEWGLASDLDRVGGYLTRMAFRCGVDDCLLTVSAEFDGRPMVCFISAIDPCRAVNKASREIGSNRVKWKKDEFSQKVAKNGN